MVFCFLFFWLISFFLTLVLFEVVFILKLFGLLSKSVWLTKLAYVNHAAKFSAVNLLNSSVVIYFLLLGIVFLTSPIFVLRIVVLTKLLVSSILFLISLVFVFKTVVVTKLLVSGIFLSTSSTFFSKFCFSVLFYAN